MKFGFLMEGYKTFRGQSRLVVKIPYFEKLYKMEIEGLFEKNLIETEAY
jgi:hypothetical protein